MDTVEAALAQTPDGPVHAAVDHLLAVEPVTVAAAIMTHNEARCIERCILNLLSAVDEIIVIDSDSTDGTLDILARYPQVKVLHGIALNDDFAGKRNTGLSHITSDWVLWVDADEWLFEEDINSVREAAGLFQKFNAPVLLSVTQVNYNQGSVSCDYSLPRMFPMRKGMRYHGRVHEQVIVEGKGIFEGGIIIRQSVRIRLHHDGYEPSIMQNKSKLNRNLRLLEMMVEEEPDNPGWLLYYGRETLGTGDVDKAVQLFLEAERKAQNIPAFGRMLDIHMFLIKIYMSQKNYLQAEEVCGRALKVDPNFPDVQFHLAQIHMRKAVALLQNAEQQLLASKKGFQSYRGNVSADQSILDWKADLSLADLALLSGKPAEAKKRYETIIHKYPDLHAVKKKLEELNTQQ
jgi:glycosyltransferase involved in cell wall biosynthesis